MTTLQEHRAAHEDWRSMSCAELDIEAALCMGIISTVSGLPWRPTANFKHDQEFAAFTLHELACRILLITDILQYPWCYIPMPDRHVVSVFGATETEARTRACVGALRREEA